MKLLVKYRLIFILWFVLLINGCMMGMHGLKTNSEKSILPIQTANRSDKIDNMLAKMIKDLLSKNFDIETITVWDIQSKTVGIDLERIRQQLINKLVNDTNFQVVSRKRLKELLEEQNLALSGVLDVDNAVAIGRLVGIEGFIDGYLSIDNDHLEINLNLIDAKKGLVLWALSLDETI
jgi:PBP1b-binding outer membrane lipoprotein LpoB